jgi:phosphohistidine phosphatase
MQIYLCRHGIAETGRKNQSDADRALTDEGKKKLRSVFETARAAGAAPELILTSPYLRAVETARIAAEVLGYKGALVPCPEITPDGESEKAWDVIRTHSDAASLLLASHEPILGYLAAYLVGGPATMFDVKKGALIRIDVDGFGPRPRGLLRWMLTPKLTA